MAYISTIILSQIWCQIFVRFFCVLRGTRNLQCNSQASNMYLRVKTEKRIRRKMLVPAPAAAPCSGARGRLEAATTHHFSGAARAAAALY